MKLHFSRDKLCMIVCWILPDLLMVVLAYTCQSTVLPIIDQHLMWTHPVLLMNGGIKYSDY